MAQAAPLKERQYNLVPYELISNALGYESLSPIGVTDLVNALLARRAIWKRHNHYSVEVMTADGVIMDEIDKLFEIEGIND